MKPLNRLMQVEEVNQLIKQGNILFLAGNEDVLKKLVKGNWIGGTIPYFMDVKGGCFNKELIFVTDISDLSSKISIKEYNKSTLKNLTRDRFENGFTQFIIPGFSEIHQFYANEVYSNTEIYDSPLVGWISGIDLQELGKITPKIVNGLTGDFSDKNAIAMHVSLPEDKYASVDIINFFEQGSGDLIYFKEEGFTCQNCLINGKEENLADYLIAKGIDTKLPLVANYSGAMINISFQNVDKEDHKVTFYAPVRKEIEYKIAKPVVDYVSEFNKVLPPDISEVLFSCNCILNYLYSELEGKSTGNITGPITFGEIAYVLVNQTLVYLSILDK